MGSKGTRSPHKMRFLGFQQNFINSDIYAFLLQHGSVNGLLTFCKNKMFGKNLVLELWSKILKANQNAGFFKLKYLANKLKFNFSM